MSVRRTKVGGFAVHVKMRGPDGSLVERRERSRTWTRAAATRRELEIRAAIAAGLGAPQTSTTSTGTRTSPAPAVPSLTRYADDFLVSYAAVHNRPSEVDAKRSILQLHLVPAFGHRPLDSLVTRDVEGLAAHLPPLAAGRAGNAGYLGVGVKSELVYSTDPNGSPARPVAEHAAGAAERVRDAVRAPGRDRTALEATADAIEIALRAAFDAGVREGESRKHFALESLIRAQVERALRGVGFVPAPCPHCAMRGCDYCAQTGNRRAP